MVRETSSDVWPRPRSLTTTSTSPACNVSNNRSPMSAPPDPLPFSRVERRRAAINRSAASSIRGRRPRPGAAGDHDHQLPEELLRLRDEYFSDGQDLVTLRMFDVMPCIERWTFAAEHGFDLCAQMGSDVERLGETGLMRPRHTYNHCSGFSDEMWKAIADSGAAVKPRPAIGLAIRHRRHRSGAAGEPTRNPGGHQLRQRAQRRTRPVHRDAHAPHGATGALVRGGVRRRGRASSVRRRGRASERRPSAARSTPTARTGSERSRVGKRADLVLIALDEVTTRLCGSDVAACTNGKRQPARDAEPVTVAHRPGSPIAGSRTRLGTPSANRPARARSSPPPRPQPRPGNPNHIRELDALDPAVGLPRPQRVVDAFTDSARGR